MTGIALGCIVPTSAFGLIRPERTDVVGGLALFHLHDEDPAGSEVKQARGHTSSHRRSATERCHYRARKTGERNETVVVGAKPPTPVRRPRIANVGDTRV
jgi:hypothetical protein